MRCQRQPQFIVAYVCVFEYALAHNRGPKAQGSQSLSALCYWACVLCAYGARRAARFRSWACAGVVVGVARACVYVCFAVGGDGQRASTSYVIAEVCVLFVGDVYNYYRVDFGRMLWLFIHLHLPCLF